MWAWNELLTKEIVVCIPFIFERQTSIADMVQILQPFEVRYSDTASIEVQILWIGLVGYYKRFVQYASPSVRFCKLISNPFSSIATHAAQLNSKSFFLKVSAFEVQNCQLTDISSNLIFNGVIICLLPKVLSQDLFPCLRRSGIVELYDDAAEWRRTVLDIICMLAHLQYITFGLVISSSKFQLYYHSKADSTPVN